MPIHRLNEQPTRRGVFADLTCDSDGKIDQFIDLRDVKDVLELHPLERRARTTSASFLVGAYQEILGDLHNLFGDTDAVHVRARRATATASSTWSRATRSPRCSPTSSTPRTTWSRACGARSRPRCARSASRMAESGRFMQRYEEALEGYTYLSLDE